MADKLKGKKILIIVENLPCPFDRRVWQEANALKKEGATVSIICPTGKGYDKKFEEIDGIAIYRHNVLTEGSNAIGYILEYSSALLWQFMLSWKVLWERGFDVIHACNPPDNIFLIGGFFKFIFGKKYLFDHHDINPELYVAKFGRKDSFYKLMLLWEKLTFMVSDLSIATNHSYRKIAIERGKMAPEKVHVVRNGPDLNRCKSVPPNEQWKNGRKFLIGYVGVMGRQEGLDYLLEGISILVHELKRTDVQLVLVGGGTDLPILRSLAKDLRVEEFVTFTGRVSDEILMEVLSTADVCVNPDVVNEMNDKSTMIKIMEYMALGKPIVQFDMTEGRYSAQESSLYAKPNDPRSLIEHIILLLDNPGERDRMGSFGRDRVKNELEWSYQVPKLVKAYQQLFSFPRRKSHRRP